MKNFRPCIAACILFALHPPVNGQPRPPLPASSSHINPNSPPGSIGAAGALSTQFIIDGFKVDGFPLQANTDKWLDTPGMNCAFLASQNKELYCNGTLRGSFPMIGNSFFPDVSVSDDGQSIAFVASNSPLPPNGRAFVVFNGVNQPEHGSVSMPVISPDGKRFAYLAFDNNSVFPSLFLDGKRVDGYFAVGEIGFSPDSQTVIWLAAKKQPDIGQDGFDVYVNGRKINAAFRYTGFGIYESVPQLVFSPDSKHWAVRGQTHGPETPQAGGVGGYAVMVDGQMGPEYGDVVDGSVQFSPDSRDLLYAAGTPVVGGYRVYRNGTPGPSWNYISRLHLINGGKNLAFTAFSGTSRNYLIHDPTPGRQPWSPGEPSLILGDKTICQHVGFWEVSSNGAHTLTARTDRKPGQVTTSLFHDDDHVADIPRSPRNVQLRFSPDGRHWAAYIQDQSDQNPICILDGVQHPMPPGVDLYKMQADDKGQLIAIVACGGFVWKLELSSTAH